jgi:hypothetical protein
LKIIDLRRRKNLAPPPALPNLKAPGARAAILELLPRGHVSHDRGWFRAATICYI